MKKYRDIAGDGGSNIVGQVEAQQARLLARLQDVRAIVAVVSGKGGVGKSSVTANLAGAFALRGARVGVLDADLNGPTMAKMLGVRGRTLVVGAGGVEPPVSALGIRVMSMDLLLADDATPLTWDAPSQAEAHTWRGTMEANALREFLADTGWGALDVLLIDLPPGTDRLATIAGLVPGLSGHAATQSSKRSTSSGSPARSWPLRCSVTAPAGRSGSPTPARRCRGPLSTPRRSSRPRTRPPSPGMGRA